MICFSLMDGMSVSDVAKFADPAFSVEQMNEIKDGVRDNLDVSIYADPELTPQQMHNIYLGLSAGINVTNYVNMVKGIESNPEKEVKSLLSQMDMYQKHQLMLGFESNVDVLKYMDPRYDWKQMRQIRYGLEKGLNVSI